MPTASLPVPIINLEPLNDNVGVDANPRNNWERAGNLFLQIKKDAEGIIRL